MTWRNQNLNNELLEKVGACTSPEELEGLLEEEGVELPDEALEAIAGGRVRTDEEWRREFAHWTPVPESRGRPDGDSREGIDSGRVPVGFASGEIDGSAFF